MMYRMIHRACLVITPFFFFIIENHIFGDFNILKGHFLKPFIRHLKKIYTKLFTRKKGKGVLIWKTDVCTTIMVECPLYVLSIGRIQKNRISINSSLKEKIESEHIWWSTLYIIINILLICSDFCANTIDSIFSLSVQRVNLGKHAWLCIINILLYLLFRYTFFAIFNYRYTFLV